MKKGNVLVLGNSGVGKSTLINAVLGADVAAHGWGMTGTTKELAIYSNDNVSFRLIDSVGFEPGFFKTWQATKAVNDWSKASAKVGMENTQVNVIWICVDGTAAKLFPETIKNLQRAARMWKSVPIIAVITKSYSEPDRPKNQAMVVDAFKNNPQLKDIIPVVASEFIINENASALPYGITRLIERTNELLPEGIQAAKNDIADYNLSVTRRFAHGSVITAATAAAVVGAVPVPVADAMLLGPIEIAMVNGLASLYRVNKDDQSKKFISSIVEVGTVSTVAKTAIAALKTIPGINLGASVINAVIAAAIVIALGEGSIYAFEQVYLGKKTLDDIDWVKKVIESKLTTGFIDAVRKVIEQLGEAKDPGTIVETLIMQFPASASMGKLEGKK